MTRAEKRADAEERRRNMARAFIERAKVRRSAAEDRLTFWKGLDEPGRNTHFPDGEPYVDALVFYVAGEVTDAIKAEPNKKTFILQAASLAGDILSGKVKDGAP